MRKITVEEIEINFNDLPEQKQKELYEKNKNKYKEDASKSIYSAIRKMVIRDEIESSEFLNRMLRNELNGKRDDDVVDEIFANQIFEIEKESIIALSTSVFWGDRERAAKLSKDSSFLNQMLKNEIKGMNHVYVYNAIFKNDIFKVEEETPEILALSKERSHRLKVAELSKDSEFLNQMLIREVNNWNDEDVINAIFDNEFFEIGEEALEILKESYYGENRKKAAKLLKDSNKLLEMCIKELQEDYPDSEVLEAIFENESFVFEKAAVLKYISDNY